MDFKYPLLVRSSRSFSPAPTFVNLFGTMYPKIPSSASKLMPRSINRKYFPYIKKAAISLRIKKLRIFGLIENNSYILTKKGLRIVQDLSNLSFGQLRINSIEAEDRILFFLSNRCSFNAEISRELNIDSSTVRGIIKRLINKNLIYFSYKDKFQRKYYKRA